MLSAKTHGVAARIDADLDELSGVDLSALSATELVRFAERCETLLRRQRVVCADIAVELAGRDVAELGGAPHKVQARIDADNRTPAQRQHAALSAVMRSLLGNPKLGQYNGLPVTVIVSASLQDLHDAAGVGITAAGTYVPMPDVIRMATHAYHYQPEFTDGAVTEAVRAQRAGTAGALERPGLYAVAIRLAQLLDNQSAVPHYASTARVLTDIITSLSRQSRRPGRLIAVRAMAPRQSD